MDSEIPTLYSRIPIKINYIDFEARPISYDMDEQGNHIKATDFETTCPDCGNAVQFNIDSCEFVNGVPNIFCGNGHSANITVRKDAPPKSQKRVVEVHEYPLLDPVVLGIFEFTDMFAKETA